MDTIQCLPLGKPIIGKVTSVLADIMPVDRMPAVETPVQGHFATAKWTLPVVIDRQLVSLGGLHAIRHSPLGHRVKGVLNRPKWDHTRSIR